MNSNIIPIFFTISDNFSPFLAVVIKSMLENADSKYFYNIHIVHENDLTSENKDKLLSLKTDNSNIIFNEMNSILDVIKDNDDTKLREDYFSLAIFFRIFIPTMFKEYDKAIYIDADVCIPGDISKLYNIELDGNIIGGCIDKSIVGIKPIEEYFTNVVGVDYREYINSGVLLLDMKKLRELEFDKHFLYLFDKYHFNNVDPDQAYINAMCKGKIKYLDNIWDTMPNKNESIINNPMIIHYNLFLKPWHYDNVGYEEYFWEYAKKTPYYDEIKEIKDNYNESDKKKDDECLDAMLTKCNELLNDEVTFKKVFESGMEQRL